MRHYETKEIRIDELQYFLDKSIASLNTDIYFLVTDQWSRDDLATKLFSLRDNILKHVRNQFEGEND